MSGRWTPGPWRIKEWPYRHIRSDAGCVFANDYKPYANARLIAAAPDLYEALEWAVNHFDGNTKCNANQETNCIEKCRDALAKARGDAS